MLPVSRSYHQLLQTQTLTAAVTVQATGCVPPTWEIWIASGEPGFSSSYDGHLETKHAVGACSFKNPHVHACMCIHTHTQETNKKITQNLKHQVTFIKILSCRYTRLVLRRVPCSASCLPDTPFCQFFGMTGWCLDFSPDSTSTFLRWLFDKTLPLLPYSTLYFYSMGIHC